MLASVTRPAFRMAAAALIAASAALVPGALARADGLPSGEVQLGQTVIEPAYNDADGSLIYLSTPINPPVNVPPVNAHHGGPPNVAPLYLIEYPSSAAGVVGTMNCAHEPMDNCFDHGNLVAGIANQVEPTVYPVGGIWGHDHLVAAPGSGGDFNILWLPIEILFKPGTPITHITTLAQLQPLMANNLVDVIPLPPATFHCSVTPAAPYNNGTPAPSVVPSP